MRAHTSSTGETFKDLHKGKDTVKTLRNKKEKNSNSFSLHLYTVLHLNRGFSALCSGCCPFDTFTDSIVSSIS